MVRQVLKEARSLGIEATENKDSLRFLSSKEILVTTIKTLINGQSTFGVNNIKKEIGSVIIDDAHACLETTESQFTLVLDEKAHDRILTIFRDNLVQQSETTTLEVVEHHRDRYLQVPFWAWQAKIADVARIIQEAATDTGSEYSMATKDAIRFTYPLIRECLAQCRCVIGSGRIEISPPVIPISVFPSFASAKRRIFLSATLSEDDILISHFDANPMAITSAITPSSAGDIGDRMIILPQELNPDFTDDELKQLYAKLAESRNVVVIVPSNNRALYWADVAKETLRADTIEAGVTRLKTGHVGLVVLVNKYDGIDLPKSACDVLVIDGLPDVRRAIDRLEESILFGTNILLSKRIQRIEQGMGRGVRSNDDFCLVFLIGKTLTNFLFKAGAKAKFSKATRTQLQLSSDALDRFQIDSVEKLLGLSHTFLNRDKGWVTASKGAVVHLKYDSNTPARDVVLKQREAFDAAMRADFDSAVRAMESACNSENEVEVKGWLKGQVATYANRLNPATSQQILKAAIQMNPRVTKPLEGITYVQTKSGGSQVLNCQSNMRSYGNSAEFLVHSEAILAELVFQPDTSDQFEQAFADLGVLLGFVSQRPEKQFGQGPDVMWDLGGLRYLIIECKNGVTSTNPINKSDCNQLNGSALVWFPSKYGTGLSSTPVMVHPQSEYEYAATLPPSAGLITSATLERFKSSVKAFSKAAYSCKDDTNGLNTLLSSCHLSANELFTYMIKPHRKS